MGCFLGSQFGLEVWTRLVTRQRQVELPEFLPSRAFVDQRFENRDCTLRVPLGAP